MNRGVLVFGGLALAGLVLAGLGLGRGIDVAVTGSSESGDRCRGRRRRAHHPHGREQPDDGSVLSRRWHVPNQLVRLGSCSEYPPCTHSAELMAVDTASAETPLGHVTDLAKLVHVPATGGSASSYVYDVKPGDYYLDVTSACAWQIALTPS